jgi:hypothetical protein
MSIVVKPLVYVVAIKCSKPHCEAREESREYTAPHSTWQARADFEQLLVSAGWRFYANVQLRAYCPDHGPGRGHRMRLVGACAQ